MTKTLLIFACIMIFISVIIYAEVEIWTANDLNDVRNNLEESYIQMADIDLVDYSVSEGWIPIGTNQDPFSGSFEGNGFTISNLYIDRPTADYQGLFGVTSAVLLSNISLINANVTANYYVGGLVGKNDDQSNITNCNSTSIVAGTNYVGGLVGWNTNNSTIMNSHSAGSVAGTDNTGALVGMNYNHSDITNCFSNGDVFGNDALGGLVGVNYNFSNITTCYSTGDIFGNNNVGGIVGLNNISAIHNCYFNGVIAGNNKVGGLVGYGDGSTINNSYSSGVVSGNTYVGGLVGDQTQSITSASYWDVEVSGQSSSAGGEGRITDEMTYPHAANTYTSWDFSDIWGEDVGYAVNNGYPYLQNVTVSVDTPPQVINHNIATYPNPFKRSTSIDFMVDKTTRGVLSVYNIRGQKVRTLYSGLFEGKVTSHFTWDGQDSAGRQAGSGVYLIILDTDDFRTQKKVLLTQ